MHESITKQDRNNINDPQKKHSLGTVNKNILLEGLNRFNGAPTSPLVQTFDLYVQVYETFGILNRQIEQQDLTMSLWKPEYQI